MKPLTIPNPAPLIDPAIVYAALANMSASQAVGISQQVLPVRVPTPDIWRWYSRLTLGRPIMGAPHILWCGYFSPATQPAIKFAEIPEAQATCRPGLPSLSTFQFAAKYWTRPVDLPINRCDAVSQHMLYFMSKLWHQVLGRGPV